MFGPAVLVVGVVMSGCASSSVIALLCAAMFCNGAITASQLVNHTDIAPNFAGEFANLLRRIY